MAAVTESIILGGGCFWCLEASFELIKGVVKVTPGYAGGSAPAPTYESVASKKTGHAEVVKVEFDPSSISLTDILDIFWAIHDPTTPNRQGNDIGPEYRSIIIYSPPQKDKVRTSIQRAQKLWSKPIVTELQTGSMFYEAEPEHHNFFQKNPEIAYCQVIINPKLQKLRQKFSAHLR
ncbi:MAG TPA: peptide-methionine (S)-S-oxide reductase MsrA [Candidatus Saccharibacteria bacterium]|nr:peptide-methionine (S)-S-oxide reductase MsrA [Candidatus Saccharibacteria bacterium]